MPPRTLLRAGAIALTGSIALATPTTVTFHGSVIDDGLFETIPLGTAWTLGVTLDGSEPVVTGDGVMLSGSATFDAGPYHATDGSVVLSVLTIAGGSISVRMSAPDATLPPLTFDGGGNQGDPIEITLTMTNTSGPAVIDTPALPATIDASDFEFTQLLVRVPLTLSPVGVVGSVDVSLGCAADLAEPLGVLNFFDIQAYIALFTSMDADADLAEPVGVFNFFDIQAYIESFAGGCP